MLGGTNLPVSFSVPKEYVEEVSSLICGPIGNVVHLIEWQVLEATTTVIAACLIVMKPLFVRVFPGLIGRHSFKKHGSRDDIDVAPITPRTKKTRHTYEPSAESAEYFGKRSGPQDNSTDWDADLDALELPARSFNVHEAVCTLSCP